MRWALCSSHTTMWYIDSARGHFKLKSICNTDNFAQSCSELFTTFFWEKPSLSKGLKHMSETHFSFFIISFSLSPNNFQLTPSHTHSQHPVTIFLKLFACLNDAGIILTMVFWLSDYSSHVNQNCIKGLILPPLKSNMVPFSGTKAKQKLKMQNSRQVLLKGWEWSMHLNELGPLKRQKMGH